MFLSPFSGPAGTARFLGLLFVFSMPLFTAHALDSGLGRTWQKLETDKKLNIAYFGGSITVGAGASDMNKTSWRPQTTAWFRAKFPDAKITEIMASIGGTGSELGTYRAQNDLIAKKPDLVFVEFAVNDHAVGEESQRRWSEAIVRQIKNANPAADIVFVYTTAKQYETYSKGHTPDTVKWQEEVANHYGIPSVNVGQALFEVIRDGGGTWDSLTKDGVHPLDAGYAIYAKTVAEFLEAHRKDAPVPADASLPAPIAKFPIDNVACVDAWTVSSSGWTKDPESLARKYPHQLTSNVPGTTLEVPFHGSAIGLYWLVAGDGGKIECAVDNGPGKTVSASDAVAVKNKPYAKYVILFDELPDKEHVLRLKVSDQKDEASTGHWIRIGTFLVFSGPGKQ